MDTRHRNRRSKANRIGSTHNWSAEQCAQVVLADAPVAIRTKLLLGWLAIRLKPTTRGSVLGREIRISTLDSALLGGDSWIGMPGELLFKCEPAGRAVSQPYCLQGRIAGVK
jgi:hypothetical protein